MKKGNITLQHVIQLSEKYCYKSKWPVRMRDAFLLDNLKDANSFSNTSTFFLLNKLIK